MFENGIDVHALSGNVPDGAPEFAAFFHIGAIGFCVVNVWKLAPAIKILAIDDTFRAQGFYKINLVIIGNDADGIGPRCCDKLDSH